MLNTLRALARPSTRPCALGVLALATALAGTPAHAAAADPAFYLPPYPVPTAPGQVLRAEPMSFAVDPLQIAPLMVQSSRILYSSTDRFGRPTVISGSVMIPKAAWIGSGSRPLISIAPGTQGLGDRCAPSRLQSSSFEYESIFVSQLLARGYAVVMTDYTGLGTPGPHTYMNRRDQGQAVLDAARAALRVPGSSLSATTRVGLTGYSQGGGAAAAAAELAASYAGDLRIAGASVGAPPADLAAVARHLDGGAFTAVVLYGSAGVASAYGVDLGPTLTDTGRKVYSELQDECIYDLAKHAFRDTSKLNNQGMKLTQMQTLAPFPALMELQRIGKVRPAMPVQVNHSLLDDMIPYAVGRDMARGWCQKGGNVRMNTTAGLGHGGGMLEHMAGTLAFFEARFAGWPMASNCGWF